MSKDIEVTDPRGYVVRCSAKYWDAHVLVKHLDLKDCEVIVAKAVTSPTLNRIFASKSSTTRHVYYGEFRHRVEIKVVVDFDAGNRGIIVSATACSRRPQGENVIWPK